MSDLKLDKDEQARLNANLRRYLSDELEVEIGNMDADFLIDFMSTTVGASFYNLGLKDAQAVFSRKADDVSDEIYALEKPVDPIR